MVIDSKFIFVAGSEEVGVVDQGVRTDFLSLQAMPKAKKCERTTIAFSPSI